MPAHLKRRLGQLGRRRPIGLAQQSLGRLQMLCRFDQIRALDRQRRPDQLCANLLIGLAVCAHLLHQIDRFRIPRLTEQSLSERQLKIS